MPEIEGVVNIGSEINGGISLRSGSGADNSLHGTVNIGNAVIGEISQGHKERVNDFLQGTVSTNSTVNGEMLPEVGERVDDYLHGDIHASFTPIENIPQNYEGSYEIDPLKRQQILLTKDKIMTQDLKVLGIYYYETTNLNGGKTVTIGRD